MKITKCDICKAELDEKDMGGDFSMHLYGRPGGHISTKGVLLADMCEACMRFVISKIDEIGYRDGIVNEILDGDKDDE